MMLRLDVPEVGRLLAGWSTAQWTLRAGQVASTVVALVAVGAAGSGLPGLWVVVTLAISAWAFFSPDSTAPAVLIVLLVVAWWIRVDDPVSGWLLVFAVTCFLIHTVTAMAAAGPPTAHYGREAVTRWSVAFSAVLAGIVAMWLALMLLSDAKVAASSWRLVVALLAVALLAGWLRLRSIGDPDDPRLLRRRDLKQ
jgi:hypothetical protein